MAEISAAMMRQKDSKQALRALSRLTAVKRLNPEKLHLIYLNQAFTKSGKAGFAGKFLAGQGGSNAACRWARK
jgi:hypothetical protein